MKEIRFGIVGMGLRGRHLARIGANMVSGFKFAAACDVNPDNWYKSCAYGAEDPAPMAEKFPETKFFTDCNEMFASGEIDAAIIETPAYHHVAVCEAALKAGLHVFGEIPPVADLHEAKRLWDAVQNAKGMFMTGANPNRWGFVRGMQDFKKAGLLGDIYYMEAEYIHDLRHLWEVSPWRKEPENVPIKYCTHSLGPLLSLIDEDLKTVYCTGSGTRVAEHGCQDLMAAQFQTGKQTIVRLMVSFCNANRHGMHSYRVFGTSGCFERFSERGNQPAKVFFNSEKLYGMREMADLSVDKHPVEYRIRPDIKESGHEGTDYDLLKIFIEALQSENPVSPISIKDGLRMTIPGIYAAASAVQGGKVMTIHYPWEADFDPSDLD